MREAESLAYVQGQIDGTKREEMKWVERGFASAREKAAGIAETVWDHVPSEEYDFEPGHVLTQKEIAERIRAMEPDK